MGWSCSVVRTWGTTLLGGRNPAQWGLTGHPALVMELMAGSLADLLYARRAVEPPSDGVGPAPLKFSHATREITCRGRPVGSK